MAETHSKDTQVYVHDGDLTAWSTMFEFGQERQLAERTAFSHQGRRFTPGLTEPGWNFEGFYGTASGEPDDVLWALRGATAGQIISHYPEGDANGNVGYVGRNSKSRTMVDSARVGELVTIRASGTVSPIVDRTVSLGAKPSSAITVTTTGPSYDRGSGADTTDLLVRFYVHIFEITASGGNAQWSLRFQESSDDGATDAFDAVSGSPIVKSGGETGGFVSEISSHDLERYVRYQFSIDATSGTLIAQASIYIEPN